MHESKNFGCQRLTLCRILIQKKRMLRVFNLINVNQSGKSVHSSIVVKTDSSTHSTARPNFLSFSKYFWTRLATCRGVRRPPIACEILCHLCEIHQVVSIMKNTKLDTEKKNSKETNRNFSPSGIVWRSCSRRFCSSVVQDCLYVSDLDF